MADEDQDQKTEAPTGKRLEEARGRGQLPISREVSAWALMVAILIVVAWLSPGMSSQLIDSLRVFLASPHEFSVDDQELQTLIGTTLMQVGLAVGAIFMVLAGAAIAGVMVQTGMFASLDLLTPDLMRLSPMNGLKRLISLNALADLVKSCGKLVVLGSVVFYTLWPLVPELPDFSARPLMDAIGFLHSQSVHLIIVLLIVFTVIALGDFLFQRYQMTKSLRMTKTEIKDEFRQQEGDPIVKGRLRQIRMEKARKRMMAQVPKADVIITNPTHFSVALQYDNKKMGAPLVLAKGVDRVAERIREVAAEHAIPLVSNPPLARALYDTVEIDHEIPAAHYRAVAEVISYVYKLKSRKF